MFLEKEGSLCQTEDLTTRDLRELSKASREPTNQKQGLGQTVEQVVLRLSFSSFTAFFQDEKKYYSFDEEATR